MGWVAGLAFFRRRNVKLCHVLISKYSLHLSCQALPLALRKLGPVTNGGVPLPWDTVRDALDHMAQAAANHVYREHFLVFWESLQVGEMSDHQL